MSSWIYTASRGGFVPRAVNEADSTGILATASVLFNVIDKGSVNYGTIRECEGLLKAVDENTRRERVDLDMRIAST